MEFKVELWNPPFAGILGTVRLMPENYYVCTILDEPHYPLLFKKLESQTANIDEEAVKDWMRREGYKHLPEKGGQRGI